MAGENTSKSAADDMKLDLSLTREVATCTGCPALRSFQRIPESPDGDLRVTVRCKVFEALVGEKFTDVVGLMKQVGERLHDSCGFVKGLSGLVNIGGAISGGTADTAGLSEVEPKGPKFETRRDVPWVQTGD